MVGDVEPLPSRIVLDLVATDLADAEVLRFGSPEVAAAHRRGRQHREALRQRDPRVRLGTQQIEQHPFLGVVGTGRIPGRRPDALVLLLDQAPVVERLIACIAPELRAHPLVQPLGECLGQAVRQGLGQNRAVVVVGPLELRDQRVEPVARGDRERAHVVRAHRSPWARRSRPGAGWGGPEASASAVGGCGRSPGAAFGRGHRYRADVVAFTIGRPDTKDSPRLQETITDDPIEQLLRVARTDSSPPGRPWDRSRMAG